MKLLHVFVAVLAMVICLTGSAFAVQTVTPVQDAAGTTFAANGANAWAVIRGAGQTLVVYGRYGSDNGNESGLGLKLQFDETKFTNVTIDQLLNKCLIASPEMQNIGAGNSQVILAWTDISVRRTGGTPNGAVGWTATADPVGPTNAATPTDGCLDVTTFGASAPQTTAAVPIPTSLFRFTATLAAGFTSGTSTITLTGTSASSAACMPAPGTPCFAGQTLVVTGSPTPPASLSNLVLSAGTLSPTFASDTLSYSANVVSASNSITVTPTVASAGATVTVNGVAVTSGDPSGQIMLNPSTNPIAVVVKAQDTVTTQTYAVNVNYLPIHLCTYSLSPIDLSNTVAAGGPTIIIVTTPAGCPVTAASFQPWVTIGTITASGGTTTVPLQVSPNSGAARATAIVVADRLYLITQLGP